MSRKWKTKARARERERERETTGTKKYKNILKGKTKRTWKGVKLLNWWERKFPTFLEESSWFSTNTQYLMQDAQRLGRNISVLTWYCSVKDYRARLSSELMPDKSCARYSWWLQFCSWLGSYPKALDSVPEWAKLRDAIRCAEDGLHSEICYVNLRSF
jgi:hypothetical protein